MGSQTLQTRIVFLPHPHPKPETPTTQKQPSAHADHVPGRNPRPNILQLSKTFTGVYANHSLRISQQHPNNPTPNPKNPHQIPLIPVQTTRTNTLAEPPIPHNNVSITATTPSRNNRPLSRSAGEG